MKAIRYSLWFLVIAVVTALIWGVLIEPRIIDEEQFTVRIPQLPANWEGKELAVLGDFQIGMWLDNEGTIDRVVDELVERRPSAVLITGDFIYRPSGLTYFPWVEKRDTAATEERLDQLIQENIDILRPLMQAEIPVYAVLGNHDYEQAGANEEPQFWIAQKLAEALEANGIAVLQNEFVAIGGETAHVQPLYLVGIGAHYPDQDNVARALDGLPADAPRVVFFHNPETFAQLPAGSAPLATAGHTHGGQIRIPLTESWSWLDIVAPGDVHADGWIDDDFGAAGNRLYVNRGIGFSIIPVRIQCPPELTIFSLTGEKA